mgnify:CR=1 FL=1
MTNNSTFNKNKVHDISYPSFVTLSSSSSTDTSTVYGNEFYNTTGNSTNISISGQANPNSSSVVFSNNSVVVPASFSNTFIYLYGKITFEKNTITQLAGSNNNTNSRGINLSNPFSSDPVYPVIRYNNIGGFGTNVILRGAVPTSFSNNNFTGTLQITSKRPVYNSDYTTMLFNYIDQDVSFQYIRNSPIQYFEGQHVNNLADVLAFYIYKSRITFGIS